MPQDQTRWIIGSPWPAFASIGATVGVAALCNLLLLRFAPAEVKRPGSVPLSPPGYIIGAVWLVLFGLMGAAFHWLRTHRRGDTRSRNLLVLLVVLCASYPAYTGGLRSVTIGLSGAVVTLALATWLTVRYWRAGAAPAARLLLPLLLWLSFACYLLIAQIRLGR
jgi:tryptophan-rich sensory protein